jgi:hypothetical protein
MTSGLEKRKAEDELDFSPRSERSLLDDVSPTQVTRLKLPSPPYRPSKKQPPLPLPESDSSSLLSSVPNSPVVDPDIETASLLLDRIHAGIKYMQTQRSLGEAIQQTTRFEIDTANPSLHMALNLLRRHGTLIASSPGFELYELGIPRPDWVQPGGGGVSGVHDAQWWVGKTAAEIKAGPYADEADVKKAASNLKGLETRRKKKKGLTGREAETEWKLREGLRRQGRRMKMSEDDEQDDYMDVDEDEDVEDMDIDDDDDDDNVIHATPLQSVGQHGAGGHNSDKGKIHAPTPLQSDKQDGADKDNKDELENDVVHATKKPFRPLSSSLSSLSSLSSSSLSSLSDDDMIHVTT